MKKKLLILAVAGLALASCSNDEVVQDLSTSDANAISIRPLNNRLTRAAEKGSFAVDDVINVWALYGAASYFDNVNFTKDASGFKSAANQTYYWPTTMDADHKVTFYATYGATQSTPGTIASATYDGETDILFAKTEHSAKPSSGISTMNFRHTLSEIDVMAKNTNAGLEVDITGVRIGYVARTASFSCNTLTDTKITSATNAAEPPVLAQSCWTKTLPSSASADVYEKTATISKTLSGVQDASVITNLTPWMLIPQDLSLNQSGEGHKTYTKKYASDATGGSGASAANLNCAYIALQLTFKNNVGNPKPTIIGTQWCYWPITESWLPGKKYTYIIDVAGGGYQPTNVDNTASDELDPVLAGSVITFDACSIDVWVTDLNNNNANDDDINVAYP